MATGHMAVCGVERGESCCEARWPLAIWLFVEWSEESVAVRQGGHWPCVCLHMYLILL